MSTPDSALLEVASMRLRSEGGRFRAVEVGADVITVIANFFVEHVDSEGRARITLLGLLSMVHFRRVCKAFCAAAKCASFAPYDGVISQRPAPSVVPLTDAEASLAADEHAATPDPLNAWHERLTLTGGKRLAIGVHHFDARSQGLSGETPCPWDLFAVRERDTSRVRVVAVRNALPHDHEHRLRTAAAPSSFLWDTAGYTNNPLHDDHHEANEGKWADYRWYEPEGAILHEFDALKLIVVMTTRDTTLKPRHCLSSAVREANVSARLVEGTQPVDATFESLSEICSKFGLTAMHGSGFGLQPGNAVYAPFGDSDVRTKSFRPTPAERAGLHPYSAAARNLNFPLMTGDIETITQIGFSRSVNVRAYVAPHVPYRIHRDEPGYDRYKNLVGSLHPHLNLSISTDHTSLYKCVEDVTLLPVSGYMNETMGSDVDNYRLLDYLSEARDFYTYPSNLMLECGYETKPAIMNALSALNPLKRVPSLPSMHTDTLRHELGILDGSEPPMPAVRWPHHEHTFLKKAERADVFFCPTLEKLADETGCTVAASASGGLHLSYGSSMQLAIPADSKATLTELVRYSISLTLQAHFLEEAEKQNAKLAADRATAAASGSTALVAFDERHAAVKPASVLTARSRKQIRKAANAPSSFRGAKLKAVMGIAQYNATNAMVMHNGRSVGADVDSDDEDDPSLVDDATASAEDLALMDAGVVPKPECDLSDSDDSDYDDKKKKKPKPKSTKKKRKAAAAGKQPKKAAKKAGKAKAAPPPTVVVANSSDEDENSEDEREARTSPVPTMPAPPMPAPAAADESEDELDAMFS